MATLSGLHAKTAERLQLDAGILLADITTSPQGELETLLKGTGSENLEKFQGIVTAKGLGATKGGATFSAVPEMRNLLDGVNGSRGNYKNGAVIDTWEISLKATVSEMTAKNIGYAIANAETTQVPTLSSTHDKKTGTVGRVKSANYINNIVWVGSINKKDTPMIIIIKNALNTSGITLTAADKDTGTVELELKAHFDIADPETVPFEIYTPKIG